jgi:hypothetical protein
VIVTQETFAQDIGESVIFFVKDEDACVGCA